LSLFKVSKVVDYYFSLLDDRSPFLNALRFFLVAFEVSSLLEAARLAPRAGSLLRVFFRVSAIAAVAAQ